VALVTRRVFIRGPTYKGVVITQNVRQAARLTHFQGGGVAGFNITVALQLLREGRPADCEAFLTALLVEKMAAG
jgi:hypothetical protein